MTSYRPPSPPGTRRIIPPARTSAGSFFPSSTSFYEYPAPTRTSRDYIPGPRVSNERVDGARLVSVRPRSPPRQHRHDDYKVPGRPRTLSLDPGEPQHRRPLSMMSPRSPNQSVRPVVIRAHDRPVSPTMKLGGAQLEASYVIPASSSGRGHHQRHTSLTSGDRFPVRSREDRSYNDNGRMRAPPTRDRPDYSYEYTNLREEALRDIAPRTRPRGDSFTGGRPASMILPDRPDKHYARVEKESGPPLSTRGSDVIGRPQSLRLGHRGRDDELRKDSIARGYVRESHEDSRYRLPRAEVGSRSTPKEDYVPYPEEKSRHPRSRRTAPEDEARSRQGKSTLEDERPQPRTRDPRDPYDDRYDRGSEPPRRHHERSHHRDHDHRKDYDERDEKDRRRDHDVKEDRERRVREEPRDRRERTEEGRAGELAAGAGVLAATGLAVEGSRHRHRHKESRDEGGRSAKDSHLREPDRDQASESTSLSGEHEEEDREERRLRRKREREREDREYDDAREESRRPAGEAEQLAIAQGGEHTVHKQPSYERHADPTEEPRHTSRRSRHRRHSRTNNADSYSDSDSFSEDDSPEQVRQPRVVDPPNEKASAPLALPPPPPKGILKPPREKFPEDPTAVREGVAPLDAAKKGIPSDARWTRINRKLVNPESLEAEGVRFEEFPDHVIVLKVMTQEEINHFATKTYEIRERRRLEGMTGGPQSE